jgi:hypothetical protein
MNTYNIEYQGITIVSEVTPEELERTLIQVRGIVAFGGKDEEQIEVILNRE